MAVTNPSKLCSDVTHKIERSCESFAVALHYPYRSGGVTAFHTEYDYAVKVIVRYHIR